MTSHIKHMLLLLFGKKVWNIQDWQRNWQLSQLWL